MDPKFVFPDFKKGAILPQEGEVGVDHKVATARIAKSYEEKIGVHRIDPKEVERIEQMSIPQLEMEAEYIAQVLERKIREQKKAI